MVDFFVVEKQLCRWENYSLDDFPFKIKLFSYASNDHGENFCAGRDICLLS